MICMDCPVNVSEVIDTFYLSSQIAQLPALSDRESFTEVFSKSQSL